MRTTCTDGITEAQERCALADDRTLSSEEQTVAPRENTVSVSSDKQPSSSKSTYNMPPAQFIPGQHVLPDHSGLDGEFVAFQKFQSSGGPHRMHHAHPSQGSLVFGGYPDSNNSSPAPPQHPFYPPPHSNGHMQHVSNGFQVLPPPGFGFPQPPNNHMMHSPALDNFGRRNPVSFQPPEGRSPSVTPGIIENHRHQFYAPSTPHSFHSHSSAPREQDAHGPQFFNSNVPAQATNGSNSHVEDTQLYHQPLANTRDGSGLPGIIPPPAMDNLDGLLGYIQSQFADPKLADYILEVRYTDDRAPPLRIPGHNLLFARSPALKRLMVAQVHDGGDGVASRTILIESADRFLRTDGFWMALQRLYGGPLLDPNASPAPAAIAETHDSATSNPTIDKFDLALGYAAAGQILQIPPVLNRGIEVACHLVNWLTLEKAVDFALDGGLSSQWTLEHNFNGLCPSTYGPAVDMLVHSALNFLITNFPPHLDFDVSAPEPTWNRRIPAPNEDKAAKHNPRLSSIKFGDHPTEEPFRSTHQNTNPASVISRILVNLPFQLLKYVLESPALGNVDDWATTALRRNVMHEVINEREERRIRVRNDSRVPNSVRIANLMEWQSVGWQEGVNSDPSRKMPTLTRAWVDFKLPE